MNALCPTSRQMENSRLREELTKETRRFRTRNVDLSLQLKHSEHRAKVIPVCELRIINEPSMRAGNCLAVVMVEAGCSSLHDNCQSQISVVMLLTTFPNRMLTRPGLVCFSFLGVNYGQVREKAAQSLMDRLECEVENERRYQQQEREMMKKSHTKHVSVSVIRSDFIDTRRGKP